MPKGKSTEPAEESEDAKKLKNEKRLVAKHYLPYKKMKKPVRYRIPKDMVDKAKRGMAGVMERHIQAHRDLIDILFEKSKVPVIAFDVEEIYHDVINVMGLKLNPDLSFEIYMDSSPKSPDEKTSKLMMNAVAKWISTFKSEQPVILIHGTNKNEMATVKKLEKVGTVCNTQMEMQKMVEKGNELGITKQNLHDFQEAVGFENVACTFIKHGKDWKDLPQREFAKIWPQQAKICVTNLANDEAPRECTMCERPQDIYLYCLEDAFTTILAHAAYLKVMGKK